MLVREPSVVKKIEHGDFSIAVGSAMNFGRNSDLISHSVYSTNQLFLVNSGIRISTIQLSIPVCKNGNFVEPLM